MGSGQCLFLNAMANKTLAANNWAYPCWLLLTKFGLLFSILLSSVANSQEFPKQALLDANYWERSEFKSTFLPKQTGSKISHRRWPEKTSLLGAQPQIITAKFVDDKIASITLLYLDSGLHFGFIPANQTKTHIKNNKEAFNQLCVDTKQQVKENLANLASKHEGSHVIGQQNRLKQLINIYQTGNLVARLHAIENQLIKVTFFPTVNEALPWIDPATLDMRDREREAIYAKRVNQMGNGDVLLNDIPLLPQGNRAYCGISSLAMAMQYLDLDMDAEDYAAAAGIRYGTTKGSKIRETYDDAAEEAGFRMSRATRFDFNKTKKSIDKGIPVLVWRRWTQDRDFLHTAFARRFSKDPTATLPEPDKADRATWPGANSYNHSTVITGYNEKRREIIFTESWTEKERNRRMRIEELEATAYYTFFLRL